MARTRVVSYSELDALRQCRLKHQLAWVERWQPPEVGRALRVGSLFHEKLEQHYLLMSEPERAASVEDVVEQVMWGLFDPRTGEQTEEQAQVEWMYRGYAAHYGEDEQWQVLGVEERVSEMLPTHRGTRSSFRLKGKVDLLVRDQSMGGGLWVVDHKTGRNLPKEKDLDMDDQMGIYIYLLRRRGLDVRGAIYNAVRSERLKSREMAPDERFLRVPLARTDKELQSMAVEAYEQFREAYGRKGPGDPPRSPDSDRCRWRCPFTEACLAGRKGGDLRGVLADTGFVVDLERH